MNLNFKEKLIIQSDLIQNAKSKTTDKVKLKVKFINNSFKIIYFISESQQKNE